MKCVCPMGGDRVCPDDCLLAVWANMPDAERKSKRKEIAIKLYTQNFTMEQIATQLGVSQATITRDLGSLFTMNKPKRPKGGRPKGTKGSKRGKGPTPKLDAAREIVRERLEADKPISPHKLQDEHGISHVTFDMAITAEVARKEAIEEKTALDPSHLSKTAQEKLDAAIRQYKKKLEAEFHHRVNERVREFLQDTILPQHRKEQDEAKRIMATRKGIMDKATFNMVRRALHPDSRKAISDQKLGEAFDAFMKLEKLLLDEKQSETKYQRLPQTMAEMDRMRAAADAERRAKRGTSSVRPR